MSRRSYKLYLAKSYYKEQKTKRSPQQNPSHLVLLLLFVSFYLWLFSFFLVGAKFPKTVCLESAFSSELWDPLGMRLFCYF